MAKPAKALKRSARATARLSKKTADRVEAAQIQMDAGNYTFNMFAVDSLAQATDVLSTLLDLFRSVSDVPPSIFIDIGVTGGGGNVTRGTDANLNDTVANIALFNATPLVTPGAAIPAASIALSNPGAGPEVDDLHIDVTVPNNQQVGLYQGSISVGTAVVVSVNVNVHN